MALPWAAEGSALACDPLPAVVTFTSRSQMGFLLLLEVDLQQELLNAQPVMGGYMFQNTAECAGFDRGVIRNDLVILAVQLSCDSNMGTFLPVDQVTSVPVLIGA